MKPIFNSLGSNYTVGFVLTALQQILLIDKSTLSKLKARLKRRFRGDVQLVYKGRDAIELILQAYQIGPGDEVLTQAFTCYAIEEAIQRVGAKTVYVDIAPNKFNPSVKNLKKSFSKTKQAKAVIIQHSLGHSAGTKEIKEWCQQHKLILIEDLAQSLGGTDSYGKPLGLHADALVLSFGRDKVVDAVAGGAAIFKTQPKIKLEPSKQYVSKGLIIRDLLYPLWTWIIRNTYQFGLGKGLHYLLTKLKLMTNPIQSPTNKLATMPVEFAALVHYQLDSLSQQLEHRRSIAALYQKNIKKRKKIKSTTTTPDIEIGTNLRFALYVSQPSRLLNWLAVKNIYLSDRWYCQPVDCGRSHCKSNYRSDSCPEAESRALNIVNLPTHHLITKQRALRIIDTINDWLT